MKPYFFQRILSYAVDYVIVIFTASLIFTFFPQSENVVKYNEELMTVQEKVLSGDIGIEEYANNSNDLIYKIDKESIPNTIIAIAIGLGYFIILPFKNNGQTLGKKLFKIKITNDTKEKLNINNYLFRAIIINSVLIDFALLASVMFMKQDAYIIINSALIVVQFAILVTSMIMIIARKDGKGLHDLLAKTKVVSTEGSKKK